MTVAVVGRGGGPCPQESPVVVTDFYTRKEIAMPLSECNACGNPEPNTLKECPYCGSSKCDACDMGDDVECPACEDLHEDCDY